MINLSASGNSVTFSFSGQSGYLNNGVITVPKNSLSLVLDTSEMAVFKKSNNDVFVAGLLSDFGMSKAELEAWYKTNMVSSGGGGDVTSGEVETLIDTALQDYSTTDEVTSAITSATDDMATQTWVGEQGYITGVDLSNYATTEALNAAVSGKADSVSAVSSAEYVSSSTTINFKNIDGTVISSIDASDFVIDGMIEDVRIETLSGASYLVIDFNTASGKEDISIPLTDIFDPSSYYNKQEVDNLVSAATDDMATQTWVGEQGYITGVDLSNYAEISAVTEEITAAVSGKCDTTALTAVNDVLTAHTANTDIHVTAADKNAWNAKSDFSGSYNDLTDKLSAGTNITIIDNVISASGGGASYTAGTNISITNDTISCTLPIVDLGNYNIAFTDKGYGNGSHTLTFGDGATTPSLYSMSLGNFTNARGNWSVAIGYGCRTYANYSNAFGYYTVTNNNKETAQGVYNNSVSASTTFGDSGNTLFSVGNGTANNARHNAFEIRQNGDIYISSGGTDILLQDHLGGGGGTIDPSLDSGSTNAVANSAITNAINEIEEVSAAAFNALNDELSGKQDTLIAGDNITISGNVISASGGGASYTAGNGISIDTANTISFNLPIYSGTGTGALLVGDNGHYDNANYKSVASEEGAIAFPSRYLYGKNVASGQSSFAHGYDCKAWRCAHAEGSRTYASGEGSHAEGFETIAKGMYCHTEGGNTIAGKNGDTVCAHAEGNHTSALTHYSHAEGNYTIAKNTSEHASGQYNNSVSASTTFGNSGNTLFSVGNGTADNARHNAFEIRQNGDIYISSGGTDIKLQDNLGGGEVSSAVTSGDTNAVQGGAVFEQLGGLKFVSLTQTEYNNLQNKDANTLYIITSGQTCTPTSSAFTNVDENFNDFSSPVYELKFDFGGIQGSYESGSLQAYTLLNTVSGSDQNAYEVICGYDDMNDLTSISIVFGGEGEGEGISYTAETQGMSITVDLCQIFGQGMYLDSEVIPNVQTCASEECTEYDCLQWDEETGECIEQGDCMQTECTQYDDNYVMYAKL